MGTSTNGQISFGIVFEEEFEFPWDKEFEGDIEQWWLLDVCKYKPPFELFDETGNYINGIEPSKDQVSAYFDSEREFLDAHRCPAELLNYCSADSPMYALVIPSTVVTARRGDPVLLDLKGLVVDDFERQALLDFCARHNIECAEVPHWILSSYWG